MSIQNQRESGADVNAMLCLAYEDHPEWTTALITAQLVTAARVQSCNMIKDNAAHSAVHNQTSYHHVVSSPQRLPAHTGLAHVSYALWVRLAPVCNPTAESELECGDPVNAVLWNTGSLVENLILPGME
eukprot:CAMPEP_0171216786 /NCGR_PEP_ID=MMETSP0790-20130122/32356_1 /TAXON_ID=2925 /ORGANISM="Alexandrium catenella, Strain OF101" /LENGTH=128 /DNA_ID=CAMNT_0011682569 /DNA_START=66 /DNA_END=452 /DNA_ORIENTATION=+